MTDENGVHFWVPGKPQTRGSKVPMVSSAGKRYVKDSNPESTAWMGSVAQAAHKAWGRDLLTGPVVLRVEFLFVRPKSHYRTGKNAHLVRSGAAQYPRGDLTKLMRAVEDAMTGVIYADDNQIVRYDRVTKAYTPKAAGVLISVWTNHEEL